MGGHADLVEIIHVPGQKNPMYEVVIDYAGRDWKTHFAALFLLFPSLPLFFSLLFSPGKRFNFLVPRYNILVDYPSSARPALGRGAHP